MACAAPGIGYETALALAGQGYATVLACRDMDKARAARDKIKCKPLRLIRTWLLRRCLFHVVCCSALDLLSHIVWALFTALLAPCFARCSHRASACRGALLCGSAQLGARAFPEQRAVALLLRPLHRASTACCQGRLGGQRT